MLAIQNPPNPWHATDIEWEGEPEPAKLEVFEEDARSILSENKSPDIGFRYSVNPYRGCFHGCAYCYARPSHQYLDFGAGTDFERKIVVKRNAVALFRKALESKRWQRDVVMFSGNTDCYQPLEASYRLTRGMLEVCLEHANPVAIITKSGVIQRDVALLAELSRVTDVRVSVSIAFANDDERRALEPWATTVDKRFRVVEALAAAGVRVGVSLSPVIVGLNDSQIPELLTRAKAAGASYAFMGALRLPSEVKDVFFERVREAFPLRERRIENAIRAMRGGKLNDSSFGSRFSGADERWRVVEILFANTCKRLGLEHGRENMVITPGRPPTSTPSTPGRSSGADGRPPKRQLSLFPAE